MERLVVTGLDDDPDMGGEDSLDTSRLIVKDFNIVQELIGPSVSYPNVAGLGSYKHVH